MEFLAGMFFLASVQRSVSQKDTWGSTDDCWSRRDRTNTEASVSVFLPGVSEHIWLHKIADRHSPKYRGHKSMPKKLRDWRTIILFGKNKLKSQMLVLESVRFTLLMKPEEKKTIPASVTSLKWAQGKYSSPAWSWRKEALQFPHEHNAVQTENGAAGHNFHEHRRQRSHHSYLWHEQTQAAEFRLCRLKTLLFLPQWSFKQIRTTLITEDKMSHCCRLKDKHEGIMWNQRSFSPFWQQWYRPNTHWHTDALVLLVRSQQIRCVPVYSFHFTFISVVSICGIDREVSSFVRQSLNSI